MNAATRCDQGSQGVTTACAAFVKSLILKDRTEDGFSEFSNFSKKRTCKIGVP